MQKGRIQILKKKQGNREQAKGNRFDAVVYENENRYKVKPSRTCPQCGVQKPKTLSQRVHQCECGCVEDRDVAAAKVMLQWALGTNVLKRGDNSSTKKTKELSKRKDCGSLRQLGSLKRQKRLSVRSGQA